jgi:hypothetical protein
MLKLNSTIHGLIDYLVVVFLWLSPMLFELPPVTSVFTYILGGIHFLLTISTEFELGIIKRIPLKIHGLIELIVSFTLAGAAFYLASIEGDTPKNFYLLFALTVFVIWMLTDYHSFKEDQ